MTSTYGIPGHPGTHDPHGLPGARTPDSRDTQEHTGGSGSAEASVRSPRELFEHALTLLQAKEMDRFTDLFAAGAVCELPFAPPGGVRRLEGREQLRNYLDGYTSIVDIASFPAVRIHETSDPEVIIVEFTAEGTTVATGLPYEVSYIVVARVHNGEFVGYRDY